MSDREGDGMSGGAMSGDSRRTDSGIELRPPPPPAVDAADVFGPPGGLAGRGGPVHPRIYPSMYRGRLWTMRQYAGMATADETNARFRYLLDQGQTGLSVAFDLPTQMGWTPTTRGPRARWARPAWRSTRWRTWPGCSTGSRSTGSRRR